MSAGRDELFERAGEGSPRETLRPDAAAAERAAPAAGTLSGDLGDDAGGGPDAPGGFASAAFEITGEVGRGGMGVVFRARQRGLGREVAVKALRPEVESSASAREKFAAEALITGRLEHPGVPPVYVFEADERGREYIAMRLVRGLPWSELLAPTTDEARRRAAELDLRGHLEILKRVCEAVAYAHSRGIIHRDLKPENVMVGAFGEVLVLDWGIAVELSELAARPEEGPRRPVGTPAYMAPEMAARRDEDLGPRTDVYLLGGILFELLTGTPPHRGASAFEALIAARDGVVEPAAQRAPDREIPEGLAEVAARALDPDPARRYGSPMELVAAIDRWHRDESARALVDFGEREVEAAERVIAEGTAKADEVYGRFAGAIAAISQAEELAPESGAFRERLAAAHVAYARYALENDDLALAEAQLERAADAPGAVEARARLQALRARRAISEARRRRLFAGLLVAGVAAVVVGALALLEARRADVLEAARERRVRAQIELDKASWGEPAVRVAACKRAIGIDPRGSRGTPRSRARTSSGPRTTTGRP